MLMAWGFRRTLLVATGALVAALAVAAPAAAATPPAPLGLTVAVADQTYHPGDTIPLTFTATNLGPSTCTLAASDTGTLTVVSATRDGQAITPRYLTGWYINGIVDAIADQAHPTPAGGTVTFTQSADPRVGVIASTPLRNATSLVGGWSTAEAGTYRFQFVYQVPAMAGSAGCAGQSATATATFQIVAASSGWWRWLAIGAVVVLAVIALAVVLLLRRSRRRHAPAAAATVLTLALGLSALGGALVHPGAAQAAFHKYFGTNAAALAEFEYCSGLIRSFDPDLWNKLNDPNGPEIDITTTTSDSDTTGDESVSLIHWNYTDHGPIDSDPLVNADPCASLDHEFNHALDNTNGDSSDFVCGGTRIEIDELLATIAENKFRDHYFPLLHTTQRHNYQGLPLSSFPYCVPALPPNKSDPAGSKHCGTSCAVSNGDPHLTTFDGTRYDFQAVGEFVAATSTTGDLTVQARQLPLYGTSTTAAMDTAVAVDVGGTRLGFYASLGAIAVHRDHAAITVADGTTSLPHGASLVRAFDSVVGTTYDVRWADDTDLHVWRVGAYGIAFTLQLAADRRTTMSGLLGDNDGSPANDIAPRGGAPITASFGTLYPTYADSWRITDATSLFDYDPGDGTATYTDRSLPRQPVTLSSAQRATAATACAAAGVNEAADLADCEIDMALTGDGGYALAARDVEVAAGRGRPDPTPTPASTTPPDTTGATATQKITVTRPDEVGKLTFEGRAGQRALVAVVDTTLPNTCGALILRGPGDVVVATGCTGPGGQVGSVLLPTTGPYTVSVQSAATGAITLAVYLSTDTTIATSIGGAPVTVDITTPGAMVSLAFDATAGQRIFVDATAATVPDHCGWFGVWDPSGGQLATGCTINGSGWIDGTTLPTTGRYTVRVHPDSSRTGRVTLRVASATDQNLSTSIDGAAFTATIGQPGAVARATFHGTAGQTVTMVIAGSTLPDACGLVALVDPDGTIVGTTCVFSGAGVYPPTKLTKTGTYTIVVDPYGTETGSMTIALLHN